MEEIDQDIKSPLVTYGSKENYEEEESYNDGKTLFSGSLRSDSTSNIETPNTTLSKRKNEISLISLYAECERILNVFKANGVIDIDEPWVLQNDTLRTAFVQIDKMYKSVKIPLGEVFARTVQQLIMLPRILRSEETLSKCPNRVADAAAQHSVAANTFKEDLVNWESIKLQRNIAGLKVLFQFPSMGKAQIQMLAKLIHALKNSEHVVLESPTGTGKTAAILSGLLSWMYQEQVQEGPVATGNQPEDRLPRKDTEGASTTVKTSEQGSAAKNTGKPKIIYLTRTHVQIKQVMQAIAKSGFKPRSCSIASRLQLCTYKSCKGATISEDSETGTESDDPKNRIVEHCRQLVGNTDKIRSKTSAIYGTCSGRKIYAKASKNEPVCPYYVNMGCKNYAISTAIRVLQNDKGTWDIEDLINFGSKSSDGATSIGCGCDDYVEVKPKKVKEMDITRYLTPRRKHGGQRLPGICPYYTSKAVAQVSDFIVCPYPYIIDPHSVVKGKSIPSHVATILFSDRRFDDVKLEIMEVINEKTNINGTASNAMFGNLENAVLIFDEGHNVERSCVEEASWDISFDLMKRILTWMRSMRSKVKAIETAETNESNDNATTGKLNTHITKPLARIINFLQSLTAGLNAFVKCAERRQQPAKDNFSGERVFHSWDRYDQFKDPLGGSSEFIEEFSLDIAQVYIIYCSIMQIRTHTRALVRNGIPFYEEYMFHLENLLAIMVMLCHRPDCYSVLVLVTGPKAYTLGIWLMNPAAMFDELASEAKSIVIASGTLAPIPAMVDSLGETFKRRLKDNILSASQTLNQDQLAIYTLSHVAKSRNADDVIECNFKNLKNNAFLIRLGKIIASLLEVMPGGTLIFFPNRSAMISCLELWKETPYSENSADGKSTSILEHIMMLKDMNFYQEPAEAAEFAKLLKELQERQKFVVFAVFRSHCSEGLNLKLSSLILVGLPFPCIVAPKVDIARRYNKAYGVKYNWYLRETYRAVNQSIGRCIRTKHDKGVIVLLDRRYNQAKEYFSSWIHPYNRVQNTVETVKHDIRTNFKF
ncbi:Regulator of telomere elongation helicase 1 [Babesia sp. Xinjiang]|uniref:Regulator of telomere elongation helicase 1 n=1 Tax=Babesia sp. Xinjiang TaxID=462227 RepID=UPI000A23F261|nr:Regulator of telomere elongation helicase 1 [Babesia sp. Xinjiang]ORM41939.1 Regulator of telomere elongation helicase 1 [Babesia sp. Xinjiang]